MAGRKSKYTPECVDKIIEALNMGAYDVDAAGYAGISVDTFTNWYNKYSDFSERVDAAKGRRVVKWLAKIEKAADHDWRAALAKLQVCHKDTYGKQVSDINSNVAMTTTVEIVGVDVSKL